MIGVPPFLGWLVGVVLLVSSPLWSTRQKLLGILIWPGGLFTVLAFAAVVVLALPPALGTAATILLGLAPLVVAAYLYRAAGRQADAVTTA